MELKNTSQKVISIGGTAVLPDGVVGISNEQAELPSVKTLIKLGYASVTKKIRAANEDRQPNEVEPAEAPDPADTPADANANAFTGTETEAEKASSGRRGKNK